jgi:hypothetical protein
VFIAASITAIVTNWRTEADFKYYLAHELVVELKQWFKSECSYVSEISIAYAGQIHQPFLDYVRSRYNDKITFNIKHVIN